MGDTTVPPGRGKQDRVEAHHGSDHHQGVVRQEVSDGQGDGKSYSDRLKTNVRYDQRLKRNILEITLEKTNNEAVIDEVGAEDVARVLKTLGIDIVAQVLGSQVHYKGKFSIVSVWMAPGVSLDKFCKDVNIKVTPGIMTGMIRPAGKKDVTVTIDGLDFNTPDSFVIDYMNKFGVVLSNAVVYTKCDTGPFKGKFSGERKFQVDFSKSTRQMGTFHIIDGSKVRIFYRGNKKTCGRCHRVASLCPGEAISRNCAAGGGPRVFLSDHMKELWKEVGFVPNTFELDADDKSEDDVQQAVRDALVLSVKNLPPTIHRQEPNSRDIENFNGITVRNFPIAMREEEIVTFLVNHGMPDAPARNHITINKGRKSTSVVIDGLNKTEVQTMFKSIHFHETKQKFFELEVPLYCKALRNMTPKKPENTQIGKDDKEDTTKEKDESTKSSDKEADKREESIDKEAPYKDTDENAESIENTDAKKPNEIPKPIIPGLPEEDRLKQIKKKKKKKKIRNKEDIKVLGNLSKNDFLISPGSGLIKKNETEDFQFSDYDDEDTDSDVCSEAFEDSRDTFSDDENPPAAEDFLTPVQVKSHFARNLLAKSNIKPSTSPGPSKRSASSPPEEETKQNKKSRARSQSLIPKKKK